MGVYWELEGKNHKPEIHFSSGGFSMGVRTD